MILQDPLCLCVVSIDSIYTGNNSIDFMVIMAQVDSEFIFVYGEYIFGSCIDYG